MSSPELERVRDARLTDVIPYPSSTARSRFSSGMRIRPAGAPRERHHGCAPPRARPPPAWRAAGSRPRSGAVAPAGARGPPRGAIPSPDTPAPARSDHAPHSWRSLRGGGPGATSAWRRRRSSSRGRCSRCSTLSATRAPVSRSRARQTPLAPPSRIRCSISNRPPIACPGTIRGFIALVRLSRGGGQTDDSSERVGVRGGVRGPGASGPTSFRSFSGVDSQSLRMAPTTYKASVKYRAQDSLGGYAIASTALPYPASEKVVG